MMIKGITLKSRLDFIENNYGKDALQRILPGLSDLARALFSDPRKIRATSWYDFGIQIEVDRAVRDHLADGDEEIFKKMGAWSAEFQREHSTPSDQNDPWKFLQLQAVIFGRYFKPGRMELVRASSSEGYMRLHEFRSARENCDSNLGFLKKHLEIFGLEGVEVTEIQCTEDPKVRYCEYHFKWKG